LKSALLFLVLVAGTALVAGLYTLKVYAPGLKAEASSVPARVHAQLAQHNAPYVPLASISPNLREAIVAIEDRRFYDHPGIDPIGIVRALIVNAVNQHIDQGGSTLEEQLIKRAIVGDDRTVHGKLRTIGLAWALDQDFSKDTVLELYLNDAYYGQGAYGAQAAARIYFGVDASSLSLPQAAFLAALPQAPSVYGAHPLSPVVVHRVRTVLADMRQSGYITAAQEQAADNTPLTFTLPNPG
jgi:penicillin-binding protein 1A